MPFCITHCRLVPCQHPANMPYIARRAPVAFCRASAMSGRADTHSRATAFTARNMIPNRSHQKGEPIGPSNQMLRRTSNS